MGRWRVTMGFAAGLLYAWLAHVASWPRLAAGMGIAFLGLLLRGWAAGYLEKGKRLAQDGPYAVWRHPLYTGSFFLAVGFTVAGTGSGRFLHGAVIWTVFVLLFCWIYPRRIREEEASLEKYFGDAWRDFVRNNHRFLPKLSPSRRTEPDSFQWARYKKNREYNAFLGWLLGLGILSAKAVLGF
ncbi:MAG: isoprenylcysteine carboxylmethyltransferase family protein [Elusimicrobia bacterium]|nr:isoprenylcysteine carboxylmethyltransferase family protein [Elusimicrobiota bacterium]